MSAAPWLTAAFNEMCAGVEEIPGPEANPRIAEYLRGVGMEPNDEIPWCAAFVNWCLQQNGKLGTGKPNARSYLQWGTPALFDPGAVVVLWRGDPKGWQGHVGFLVDRTDEHVYLLGGNQHNRVSVAHYPRARVLGCRWPA